jgi:hypothetical protein
MPAMDSAAINRVAKHAGIALVSIILGFFLMIPLSMIFDKMNWPLFHSWGLAHGSFLLAWPLLTLLSFAGIEILMILRQTNSD